MTTEAVNKVGLPVCRHRGMENVHGRFSCSSPAVPFPECLNSSGVRRGQCRACPVPDQGAPRLFEKRPAPPRGEPPPHRLQAPAPADGPGSELERLIVEHRLTRAGCDNCQGLKLQMNRWGLSGCRGRREQILARLRKAYRELTPAEAAGAALAALWSGLAFKLNPLDPAPGLLDEALKRWEKKARAAAVPKLTWSAGVMTVPQRRGDLFPRTLASLKAAGWEKPRLFVDGDNDPQSWEREFGLETTCRNPRLHVAGAWVANLWELYIRDPWADRYLLAQDDLTCPRNLRPYLEACPYRPKTYWNCYTFPANQQLCPPGKVGWFESNQRGKGAVLLVFDRDAAVTLLSAKHMVGRFQDRQRGHKAVDGGIVEALGQAGYVELCHSPSLTQHTGRFSTMNKRVGSTRDEVNFAVKEWGANTFAVGFPGPDFDALDWLACR